MGRSGDAAALFLCSPSRTRGRPFPADPVAHLSREARRWYAVRVKPATTGAIVGAFDDIPKPAIDYVRRLFRAANRKVSLTVSTHPSMHEETLDHILVMELTAAPPAFFADSRVGISMESHWLGGRRLYGRREIADIAFFVVLRRDGHLLARKVALLQTKRLYSKEIPVVPIDDAEYRIGIGRLVDRTEPTVPLSSIRRFHFDRDSHYREIEAESQQISNMKAYIEEHGIPVFYGLYNPVSLPFKADYPPENGIVRADRNNVGMRIVPSQDVHSVVEGLAKGSSPTLDQIAGSNLSTGDDIGWRLETFIANEVLRCRQGHIFGDGIDPTLEALLYRRAAPITSAITITIDLQRPERFATESERQAPR